MNETDTLNLLQDRSTSCLAFTTARTMVAGALRSLVARQRDAVRAVRAARRSPASVRPARRRPSSVSSGSVAYRTRNELRGCAHQGSSSRC